MARFGKIGDQYEDDEGKPLAQGKLYFFESGTNTDKDTFADVNETIPNTNPVILSAAGRPPNIFFSGSARVMLTNSDDVQIEVRDPEGADTGTGQLAAWNAEFVYNLDSFSIQANKIYRSLTNPNQGNDPSTSPTTWEEVRFIGVYNANKTYAAGDVAQTTDGNLWASQVASNIGNDPATDSGTNWLPAVSDAKTSSGIRSTTVLELTGGGAVTALRVNQLQDAGAYTLPLANSVSAGQFLTVEVEDTFSSFEPTLARSGSDTITYSGGTDTDMIFDTGKSISIRFTSDGVSDWSI